MSSAAEMLTMEQDLSDLPQQQRRCAERRKNLQRAITSAEALGSNMSKCFPVMHPHLTTQRALWICLCTELSDENKEDQSLVVRIGNHVAAMREEGFTQQQIDGL